MAAMQLIGQLQAASWPSCSQRENNNGGETSVMYK